MSIDEFTYTVYCSDQQEDESNDCAYFPVVNAYYYGILRGNPETTDVRANSNFEDFVPTNYTTDGITTSRRRLLFDWATRTPDRLSPPALAPTRNRSANFPLWFTTNQRQGVPVRYWPDLRLPDTNELAEPYRPERGRKFYTKLQNLH